MQARMGSQEMQPTEIFVGNPAEGPKLQHGTYYQDEHR